MKLHFVVHRANEASVSKTVQLDGELIGAVVPSFEVELVSDVGTSYIHRFTGKDVAEAKEKFKVGESVVWDV